MAWIDTGPSWPPPRCQLARMAPDRAHRVRAAGLARWRDRRRHRVAGQRGPGSRLGPAVCSARIRRLGVAFAPSVLLAIVAALSIACTAPGASAQEQGTNTTTVVTEACPASLPNEGRYTVSSASDVTTLATALASCTGGEYNVSWQGAVVLSSPLELAEESSLTVWGSSGADGQPATLNGNTSTGLMDLGRRSSLYLRSVTLRNAWRSSGNGGAIQAEADGAYVSAVNSTFEGNTADAGGAIALGSNATAEFENCTIVGNRALSDGGGIYMGGGDSSIEFENCAIENNTAGNNGGALVIDGHSGGLIQGTTVMGNFATAEGGGVYATNATLKVEAGSLFVNNTVYGSGGGISLRERASLTVADSFFRTNGAFNYTDYPRTGGAIRAQGSSSDFIGSVNITDSVFRANYAPIGGALWITSGFHVRVERTAFDDNYALAYGVAFGGAADLSTDGAVSFAACNFTRGYAFSGGGALNVEGSDVSVLDCLFNANGARFEGGAIRLEDGAALTLERCTLTNNSIDIVQSEGGAGAAIVSSESTLIATDCIFNDNQAGYVADANDAGVIGGGAVFMSTRSNATFQTCNFTNNSGADGGALLAEESSSLNLRDVYLVANVAGRYGGAVSLLTGSWCLLADSSLEANTGALRGGGFYLNGAACRLEGVMMAGNTVTGASGGGGGGGAMAFFAGSNATITGGSISSNEAGTSGGHIFATGSGTNVNVSGPLQIADGYAVLDGGAVRVGGGATFTARNVVIVGNRAEDDGGGVNVVNEGTLILDGCNVSSNACGGHGGGVSVTNSELLASRSTFEGNTAATHGGGIRGTAGATLDLSDCRLSENTARMGGGVSSVGSTLVAQRCDVSTNIAGIDGGGVWVSYESTASLTSCDVRLNTASGDGGGVTVDASPDTTDGSLFATDDAASVFLCRGRGNFSQNVAGGRGGAVYVTRGSVATWEGCSSTLNSASLGAAIYASHSSVNLSAGSLLAYEEASTGAIVYASSSDLEAHNASFVAEDSSSMAVQMTAGSSMKALACSFSGWTGSYVVLTAGILEMDMCDFRGSQAEVLVSATNANLSARIRNTAVGLESYESLASGGDTTLSENVQTCASDPCSSGASSLTSLRMLQEETAGSSGVDEDFADLACVDGNLGVYCPCLEATVTGEEECLGENTTVSLEGPENHLIATGVDGVIESNLNITAGGHGGVLVWGLREVVKDFTEEGLTWTIVPNVGILEPGQSATVAITGELKSELNGLTYAFFKAESLQSGASDGAFVNTTFYYCTEGNYFDLEYERCFECGDISLSEGLECNEPGVTLATLPLAEGYWRATDSTTDVRACLYEKACSGGGSISTSDDYCADGYKGPYCAVCAEDYAGGISNGCHLCSESFVAGMFTLASVGGVAILLLLYGIFRYLTQEPSSTRDLLSCRNRLVDRVKQLPLYKLKIPIVVFQIVTQYADVTNTELPPAFNDFLSYVDVVNLDPGWILSASCILTLDFYQRLLLTTLAPLVLVCALACTYMCARSRVVRTGLPKNTDRVLSTRRDVTMSESRQLSVVKTRHMVVLVTLTFLVYSTVSTVVFQTFACDHIEDLGETYLRADYSLLCNTPEHNWYKIYSSIMIAVYPVGIPLLYATLLLKHRHRIYPKQALRDGVSPERRLMDKKIAHTVLLWEAYRPSRYYYEVIECFRRLLLTGCLVFILPNTAGQAAVACVLSMASVCIFITLRPFTDINDERLYILGCIVVFLSMFASLIPTVQIADNDDQSKTVFAWVLIALSAILAILAVVQCFWEVRAMTRSPTRLRSDESASGVHLMDTGGRGLGDGDYTPEPGSVYKNTSPDDAHTDNPSSSEPWGSGIDMDGTGASGRKASARDAYGYGGGGGGRDRPLANSSDFHPSGSSGGSRTATGYADPVDFGVVPGKSSSAAVGDEVSAHVDRYGSRNTYGPLAAISASHNAADDGGATGGGGGIGPGMGRDKFPPIHPYDDEYGDSPNGAGQALAYRAPGLPRRDQHGHRGLAVRREQEEEKGNSSGGPPRRDVGTGPVAYGIGGRAMFPVYDEQASEVRAGEALHLSPAEPMAGAFPAPTTNAFPASTYTPESDAHSKVRGQRPRDGSGAAGTVLSPSPASTGLFMSGESRRHLLGASPQQSIGASPATQVSGSSPATQLSGASPSTQLLGPSPPASDFTPSVAASADTDESNKRGLRLSGRLGRSGAKRQGWKRSSGRGGR